MIFLSEDDVCRRLDSGDRIYIVRQGKPGCWEIVEQVYAWMDMAFLELLSGENLNLEEYGDGWKAYKEVL